MVEKIKILPDLSKIEIKNLEIEKNFLNEIYEKKPAYLRVVEDEKNFFEVKNIYGNLKEKFEKLIVIGIGGSILGAEAIVNFCKGKPKNLFFLDNIDSKKIINAKKLLKKGNYGVCVISKSGKTLETNLLLSCLLEDLKNIFKDNWKERLITITSDKKNPLNDWARENNIKFLFMPEDLSGRFSVFSSVGIFPLLFEKIKVEKILKGAREAIKILKISPEKNIISKLSEIFIKNPFKTLIIFTYGEYLFCLGRWFQQLWAESLGKDGKFGQIPLVAIGTQDQHSILQMISDVKENFITWIWMGFLKEEIYPDLSFIGEELKKLKINEYLKASGEGVYESLKEKGADVLFLDLKSRNESFIGYILCFFMLLCHLTSLKIKVETFNQPAVEFSKKITILKLKEKLKNI